MTGAAAGQATEAVAVAVGAAVGEVVAVAEAVVVGEAVAVAVGAAVAVGEVEVEGVALKAGEVVDAAAGASRDRTGRVPGWGRDLGLSADSQRDIAGSALSMLGASSFLAAMGVP
jgi:hypothetical protein